MARSKVTARTCQICGNPIFILCEDVRDVVYYKKYYYHTSCFRQLAEQRSNIKRGKPEEWKEALNNIEVLEQCAKDALTAPKRRAAVSRDTDPLNEYLLSHYNVDRISNTNFWKTVKELQNGVYKQKKCQKVSLDTLLAAWKWAQPKLDKINRSNRTRNKGPKDNKARISYDLAILVGHISDYLAYKAKQEAAQAEIKTQMPRINYDSLQRTTIQDDGLDDISYLLEDDDD